MTVVSLEKQAKAKVAEMQLRLDLAREQTRQAQQDLQDAQLRWSYAREAERALEESA